jgi:hypothetical protein
MAVAIENEPAGLIARPHYGRFPIPYVTAVVDGVPDFRSHDHTRRRECAEERLCQLCGLGLGSGPYVKDPTVFVGFAWALNTRRFGEPPMHESCMEFAWRACPWLAAGSAWRVLAGGEFADRPPTIPQAMVVVWTGDFEFEQDTAPAARGKDVLVWTIRSYERFELRRRGGL